MSRFTVGQEISVIKTQGDVTYGKFYTVTHLHDGDACILDDAGDVDHISDDFGLTREEYEQAEREKDPFAPGKWVVCVQEGAYSSEGELLQCETHPYSIDAFMSPQYPGAGFWKSHFRPATPEEIKAQEMKLAREAEPAANRQTFTVGGREFYVGQSVWVNYGVLGHTGGKPLEVVGYIYNTDGLILVRPSDALFIIQLHVDGLMTEQPKPHEWKFRDWARHPWHGICFVISGSDGDDDIKAVKKDGTEVYLSKKEIAYISTAEIPE